MSGKDGMETQAEIVAEMRTPEVARCVAAMTDAGAVMRYLDAVADRIEAAAKRERIALVAEAEAAKDARNRMGLKLRMEFQEKCKNCPNVNAAKIREALEAIVGNCRGCAASWCDSVCRPGLSG